MLLDVDSVPKSLNAIESVLLSLFSGVLATVTRERENEKGKSRMSHYNL